MNFNDKSTWDSYYPLGLFNIIVDHDGIIYDVLELPELGYKDVFDYTQKKLKSISHLIINENGTVIVKLNNHGVPISFEGKDVSNDLKEKIASNF